MAKIFCKRQVEKKNNWIDFSWFLPLKWNEIFFEESSFTNIISSERKWQTFRLGSETYYDKLNWCSLCKLGTKFLGYFPISRLQRIDFSCNKYLFLLSEANAVSLIAWYKTKKESIHYSQEFIVHFQFIIYIIFSSMYSFIATVFCRF